MGAPEGHIRRLSPIDQIKSLMGSRLNASGGGKDDKGEDKGGGGTRDWSQVPPPGMDGGNGGDAGKPQRERGWGGILGGNRPRHGN